MSAGGPRRVRWRGSARAWLTVTGVSGALLVAACSTSGAAGPGHAPARPGHGPGRTGPAPGGGRASDRGGHGAGRAGAVSASVRSVPGRGAAARTGSAHPRWAQPAVGGHRHGPPAQPGHRPHDRGGPLAAATPGAAGATLNGRDFLFGGGGPAGLATVQQISSRGAATVISRLPGPRSGLAAVTIGGTAYLLGGAAGTGSAADVLATTDGRHFRTVARLPVPVRDPAVAALGDQIWVFGGQAASGPTSDIQRVTVPGAAQHGAAGAAVAGQLPRPVTGAAAVALGGTLFVAGGQVSQPGRTPGTVISGQVLSYHPGQAAVSVAGAAAGASGQRRGGGDRRHRIPGRRGRRRPPGAHGHPDPAGPGAACRHRASHGTRPAGSQPRQPASPQQPGRSRRARRRPTHPGWGGRSAAAIWPAARTPPRCPVMC